MENTVLSIQGLTKSFDDVQVLKSIDLSVGKGEFVTLLGPSGCGKTTTLRIIAGLERPDRGKVVLNGIDITEEEPENRKVNTVFQNYALFPHMDVYANVAYGLKIRKTPKDEIEKKVGRILALVEMNGYEKRKPDQLSGGQRQRIAIARALVNEPEILLLDEPLGALDLKLRHHMQAELKAMQKELKITFIYVTHDQDEALNMSDRLVVMNEGEIRQAGAPKDIYDCPADRFVAEFVGERNIIEGIAGTVENGLVTINFAGTQVRAVDGYNLLKGRGGGLHVSAAIHSDRLVAVSEAKDRYDIKGKVKSSHFSGAQTKLAIQLEDGSILKKIEYNSEMPFAEGSDIYISWNPQDCKIIEVGGSDGLA